MAYDYSLMITKQPAWTVSRAGGAVSKSNRRQYYRTKQVKITDLHTNQIIIHDSCAECDNINGWTKGRTAQSAKREGIIDKRYKVEYAGNTQVLKDKKARMEAIK